MPSRKKRIAAVTLVTAVLGVGAVVAYNPYLLVKAQFERQRVIAGLEESDVVVAGHRGVYAWSDDAPKGAPIVVMIHGFTGSKENWYPLAERLRGRYHLLIPDLPGWGESERKPGGDYGYSAQAAYVATFIEQVARQLGLGEGTVASRLSRARALLTRRLARHELALSVGSLTAALSRVLGAMPSATAAGADANG